MAKKLRTFNHFVYVARWGTVMVGILHVLDVWDDLCWGWNIAALLHNVADAELTTHQPMMCLSMNKDIPRKLQL
jgi:hypothetical protein